MMNFLKMTVKELIAYCKAKDIKGYSRKKKAELIDMLTKSINQFSISSEPTTIESITDDYGKKSFKNGITYQHGIANKLKEIAIDCQIIEVKGANSGVDISLKRSDGLEIGIEVKNKGAFEGGSAKMQYNETQKRLVFPDSSSLHQACLGDIICYNGRNLPYYEKNSQKQIIFKYHHYLIKKLKYLFLLTP